MITHLVILAASLALLVKGADYLVEYAVRIAHRFRVSDLVAGLVITSVGTSLPELSSSIAAAWVGSSGLVIGNVVGSNIANIGLVLGVGAVLRPFATQPTMYDRDGFILVASTALVFGLALDNRIGRLESVLLLVLYVAFVVFVARSDREGVELRFRDFLKFVFDFEYAAPVVRGLRHHRPWAESRAGSGEFDRHGLGREVLVSIASLAAVIVGARFVVGESIGVAQILGVPENLIGLSIVAIGTSLPELLVSIAAARRGNAELIVGNVMGSNIANGLLIIGVAGLIRPLDVPELSVVYTIPVMIFFTLALLYFIRSDWKITRRQGMLAVAAYLGFLVTAFVLGLG